MHSRFLVAWTLSIAAAAPLTWAQAATPGVRADPQDAKASVPRAIYRSSLGDYRIFSDENVGSWREANDKVGRIGGWRAYAKEAQEPEPAGGSILPGANRPAPADGAKPMQGRPGDRKMN